MNPQAIRCVESLAESIEENDRGGARYSGESTNIYDYLMPILVENLDINPEGLRISEGQIYREINQLLLEVRNEDDPVSEFEAQVDRITDRISEIDVNPYTIAFPLNFDSKDSDLLPETLVLQNTEFEQIDLHTWNRDWVPDYSDSDENRKLMELDLFLKKSPNELENSRYTYWKSTCYARNKRFAVNQISKSLTTILGQLNYAMTYNRSQGRGTHSGPWPKRWSELRSPFIFLVYLDGKFEEHAFPNGDASYRKPESPHSARKEVFEHVFGWLPTFEVSEPIDTRLIESFNMFQAGITNPYFEQGFFEFWRGIEILASIDDDMGSTNQDDAIAGIVDRVSQIYDWKNQDIAELRLNRISSKRNEFVHEGEHESINRNDYNLTKTLLEGIIGFACGKRTEWDVGEWIYVLNNFETNEANLENKQRVYSNRIELLDEMKDFGS